MRIVLKLTPSGVRELIESAIVLVIAILLWRLAYAAVDRFYGRRFVSRFIPRVATFSRFTKSFVTVVVIAATILTVLAIWQIDVTAGVWSAGIVTAALAFGAQTLVRDILAGFFCLVEDQYDVGDSVELTTTVNSVITGTVEAVDLRTTRVVDERGRQLYIPNGNILYTTNASRAPNRAAFEIALPLTAPIADMRAKLEALVGDAAEQFGLPKGAGAVTLTEIKPDAATFQVAFRAPRAELGAKVADVRERVAAGLQTTGWLPSGR